VGAICQHAEASAPRVLVAENQPHVRDALRLLLKSAGFQITDVATPAAVLAELSARPYDALLLDLNYTRDTTSGAEGLELLPSIRQLDRTIPVVVMTAWGTVEVAVEALRCCSRWWGFTACWHNWWRSASRSSASAWRWARRRATCCGW
jgi:DNA-binding NtrC family response regulator